MRTLIHLALACLVMCGSAAPAKAEIYRWTDQTGVVHFGERPPMNGGAERIEVKNLDVDPQAIKALQEIQRENESARKARLQKRTEIRQRVELEKRKAEQCANAKAHRERLVNATRLFKVAADGSRERLGEEARDEDLKRIDTAISELCA